jgi:hypothetical protein
MSISKFTQAVKAVDDADLLLKVKRLRSVATTVAMKPHSDTFSGPPGKLSRLRGRKWTGNGKRRRSKYRKP